MTAYAVDSKRMSLRTTGIVNPVREWGTNPATGKRRKTEVQQVNEAGEPEWDIEATFVGKIFGEDATITANVRVPSATRPVVSDGDRPEFVNLWVEERGNRTDWWADGIKTAASSKTPAGAAS